MGEAMILEVLDHRGRVLQRHRLGAAPVSVGRGLRNSVIIDDPYVDPDHLLIEAGPDSRHRFRDLGSVNGTWEEHHRRTPTGALVAGTELRIGRTTLRFVSADRAVPPALYDPSVQTGVVGRLLQPRTAVLVLVTYLAISAGLKYLDSPDDPTTAELLSPGLAGLLLAGAWAAMWAFTNRIVAQRFRFMAHWGWAIAITLGLALLGVAFEWLGFFAPGTDLGAVQGGISAVLIAWLLAGHFQMVTEWSVRRRWGVATAITGAVAGLIAILGRPGAIDAGASIRQTGSLKPIAAQYLPATDLDQFFSGTTALKTRVDRMADDSTGAGPDSTSTSTSTTPEKR